MRGAPSSNIVVETRYPYELTASIETIEGTLWKSFESFGGCVDQPAVPIDIGFITVSDSPAPDTEYPIKVESLSESGAAQYTLYD